jgi:D-arabinose 1-dehydrogenase-like Zn-dependent alcohol dehydrogenase
MSRTYKAVRVTKPGTLELVAIQGVGGLGHLGIQFARRMGFHVAAIARGPEKESLAKKLGAHDAERSSLQNGVGHGAITNEVNAFCEAAMAAGATDNGKPGARRYYDPRYYAANVFDPDGYSLEAVYKSRQHRQS